MATGASRHISRPDVLRLAEALGIRWNGLDTMPALFGKCVERARRLRSDELTWQWRKDHHAVGRSSKKVIG